MRVSLQCNPTYETPYHGSGMDPCQYNDHAWEVRIMQTTVDSRQLTHPIDALHLIHKALRAEAMRVEDAVDALQMGGSFKPFQRAFYRWAMALGYHEEVEDHYFTIWLPDTLLAQGVGPGHVMAMLEDLQTYLHTELARMIVIPRTQRQLRSKVIALGIVQDDLLEEEEERLLPEIRQRISATQQLELIQHLLTDEAADEQGNMLDWVARDLTTAEQQWLADLCSGQYTCGPRCSSLRWRSASSMGQEHTAETITTLNSPIDVMYPIHRALRAEAAHAEAVVRALESGGSFQPLAQVFQRWATALEYHAVTEDQYMTASLDRPSARTNEAEHRRLTELLADLQTYLREVGGPAVVTARTRRHALGKVVMLRVTQDDHLEEEEERILPVIRQQLSATQQCDLAQRLLLDRQAQDAGWPLAWLTPHVTATERQWLAELVRPGSK
jgi:Hemerythrin HHE cation binding domain